jgi:hypothetical protein
MLPNSFYEANITPILKPNKDTSLSKTTKKKTVANILSEYD